MTIKKIKTEEINFNEDNPRFIKDDKYKQLVKSIKEFPQMLEIRPIVIDENNIVLGGNMRLKACRAAGLKEIPTIKVDELSEEQKKEFVLKDNQSYGEWDNELLSLWDKDLLLDSGFEKWELIDIFKDNQLSSKFKGNVEGSNFKADEVDVDSFIKQNIIFINEFMLEFEDDEVKEAVRNLKDISSQDQLRDDIKEVILRYGKNSV